MKCPTCGSPLHRVLSTRVRNDYIERRRECFNLHRWTTKETQVPERKMK